MILYMLRLGSLGFGGPVALVGYMHRDLVDDPSPTSHASNPSVVGRRRVEVGPPAE